MAVAASPLAGVRTRRIPYNVLSPDKALEFIALRNLVADRRQSPRASRYAGESGHVAIEKLFVGKRPQTRVKATRAGRRAFADHVAYLREIPDGDGDA